jgi:hypothetical protein
LQINMRFGNQARNQPRKIRNADEIAWTMLYFNVLTRTATRSPNTLTYQTYHSNKLHQELRTAILVFVTRAQARVVRDCWSFYKVPSPELVPQFFWYTYGPCFPKLRMSKMSKICKVLRMCFVWAWCTVSYADWLMHITRREQSHCWTFVGH